MLFSLHVDTGQEVAFNLSVHVYSDNKRAFHLQKFKNLSVT